MTDREVRKVLITGATGFIGRNLCECLLASGFLVRAMIKKHSSEILQANRNLEKCFGNILDEQFVEKACRDVDAVVHLAGLAHATKPKREELCRTNIIGTELLLSAAIKGRVKRFVFMSSSLAVANFSGTTTTAYGRAKLAAEQSVMSQHKKGNIEGVVFYC